MVYVKIILLILPLLGLSLTKPISGNRNSVCNPLCGSGVFHAAGICQDNGRCLCWWGWTGPNGIYINGGPLNNRILADYCMSPCHFMHDCRNPLCASEQIAAAPAVTATSTTTSTTTTETTTTITPTT